MNEAQAELARTVRMYLRSRNSGALSTISSGFRGHPYTSSVAYILDEQARPIFLASHLAEHSANIAVDSRASLLIADADEFGTQSGRRATVLGDVKALDAQASTALTALYTAAFPASLKFLSLGGFRFYIIEPLAVRYIGGFGKICWLSREDFQLPGTTHANSQLIEVLNMQTRNSILQMARTLSGTCTTDAEILSIDPDGVYLRVGKQCRRLEFPTVTSLDAGIVMTIKTLADSLIVP